MCRLSALIVFSVLVASTASLSCFQGQSGNVSLQKGFDYCVTIVDMRNQKMSYAGLTGETEVFIRDEFDLSKGDCFLEAHNNIGYSKCYCRQHACNRVISLKQFKDLFFSV